MKTTALALVMGISLVAVPLAAQMPKTPPGTSDVRRVTAGTYSDVLDSTATVGQIAAALAKTDGVGPRTA